MYRTVPPARTGMAASKARLRALVASKRPRRRPRAPGPNSRVRRRLRGYTGARPMREMTVYGVSFDLVGKQPIVLLKTADGDKFLPIWIGHPEAAAILMKLQGHEPPRPKTHDLATSSSPRSTPRSSGDRHGAPRQHLPRADHPRAQRHRDRRRLAHLGRDRARAAQRAKIYAADEVIEESGVEFEGDGEEASRRFDRQEQSLADLDPDEFRRFLDTVSPEEFAGERGEDE